MKSFLLLLRTGSSRFFTAVFYKKKKSRSIARFILCMLLLQGIAIQLTAGDLPKNSCFDSFAPTAISVSISKTDVSACGNGSDGSINATPSGGTAPYSYSWTGPNGFNSTSQNISGLAIGYYNLTITDAAFVTSTVSGIHILPAFSPTITNSGSISAGCANTGSIILYGNAGVPPYTYSLDGTNYQAVNTFTDLAAATYTAYIKDNRGCTGSKSITVLAAAPVVVTSYVRPASNCNNDGSIELYRSGGIAPYTYSLDNITYQASNVFTGLAAGSVYTGWVMDSKGCKGSQNNITVTQVPQLTASFSKMNSSTCVNDGTIQVRAAGGVAPYTYSIGDVTYQAGSSFGNLAPGTYACWVKDSKGCKATVNVTLGTNPIVVTAYTAPSNSCNTNGSIQLFRTGGVGPYTYSLNNINYRSSNMFTNLPGGVYTAWVKDSKGCIGTLSGITVVTGVGITVTATKTNTSTCINNGSIKLNPVGGRAPLTYSKDNITYQASDLFTQLGAGNYVCWVKDANGCKASVNVTINLNYIVVTAAVTAVTDCVFPDGTIRLSRMGGTGGFTYSLDGENYQSDSLFTDLEAGEYTAFVKDSNICIGSLSSIIVTQHCSSFTGKTAVDDKGITTAKKMLKLNAYPNPSANEFTLALEGYGSGTISIKVTDMMGRIVWQQEGNVKQQYKFGNQLKAGLYNVQVTEGNDSKTIKLVKE